MAVIGNMRIILLILLLNLASAESYIYLGQGDDGKLMAGVTVKINIGGDAYIESDTKSTGLGKAPKGVGFSPKEIEYHLKLHYKGASYRHYCVHNLDAISTTSRTGDYIGYEYEVSKSE